MPVRELRIWTILNELSPERDELFIREKSLMAALIAEDISENKVNPPWKYNEMSDYPFFFFLPIPSSMWDPGQGLNSCPSSGSVES